MALQVVGFGAGGHAKVVIEILQSSKDFELVGLLDPAPELLGQSVLGVPVLGGDDCLGGLISQGVKLFFVGVGSTVNLQKRRLLYKLGLSQGMKPVDAIHPGSFVSSSAEIGSGVTVMALAVINATARLGENVVVNTGVIVEHDSVIGSHTHIATGALLCGSVKVGEGSHIGAGSVIRQGINIGKNVLVGAGSVVVKDVQDGTVVIGNPARPHQLKDSNE